MFDRIIKPLARSFTEGELAEGIASFFHVDTRKVYFAKALRTFTLPGKEWVDGHPMRLGYCKSPRRVMTGMSMVVRFDSTTPNKIDVEFGRAVFTMDKAAWNTIKDWVQLCV